MADTGSEIAQDLARSAAMMATRALVYAIADARAEARMRARAALSTDGADAGPRAGTDRQERTLLAILPAGGATREQRAEELRGALLDRGADGVSVTYGTSGRTVVLLMDDREAARAVQEAIEELHADGDSTFDLSECFGIDALERATGRHTSYGPTPSTEHVLVRFSGNRDAELAEAYAQAMRSAGLDATHRKTSSPRGTEHVAAVAYPTRRRLDFTCAHARVLRELRATARVTDYQPSKPELEQEPTRGGSSPDVADPGASEPREHVVAIFAADPEHDRESAEAYAEAMRERGYDPWHAAMGMGDHVHHTVELSYPATRRARFAADHVDALEAIGAAAEVEVIEEPIRAGTTLEQLIEGHMAARDARESTVVGDVRDSPSPSVTAHGAPGPARGVGTQARDGRLTAREYLALPARERARIPAERIPDGAFGAESLADVARQARGASHALERGRERHIVPSIGERG